MNTPSLILRTTVSSTLLKQTLLKGFALAFFGIFSLVLGAVFIPLDEMHKWGWILFLFSLSFIVCGLLPYRRLVRLQMKPNEIEMDLDSLIFFTRGKKILTLPLDNVAKWSYLQYPKEYGIGIWVKKKSQEQIIIHQRQEGNRLRQHFLQKQGPDLFFPYFNQRSFDELRENEEKNED